MPDLARDTARLVVSELATNAVKHTEGPYGMELTLVGRTVEITVWDSSTRPIVEMRQDPARVGRHGMEIVAAVCGTYDVVPTATGKRVTVHVPL